MNMKKMIRFLKDKSGATAIEYGLIAALIAVAIIGGVTAVGEQANATFNGVSNQISAGNDTAETASSDFDTSAAATL